MAEIVPEELHPVHVSRLDRSFDNSGVYFLFSDEEVVYVGQSNCVLRRIGEHMSDCLKVFDGVAMLPCLDLNRLWLEEQYIKLYRPRYNGLSKAESRRIRGHRRRRGRNRRKAA